jgi:hypothetical protein
VGFDAPLLFDKFYKILVTPDTIQVFDQNIGSLITDDVWGQAVFSPDGSKYVLFTDHALDLYDFDRCSGELTNHQSLYFPDSVYRTGIAFSPNNRFLYANTQLNIFQYDLWASNIDSSVQLVAPWIPATCHFQQFSGIVSWLLMVKYILAHMEGDSYFTLY